MRVFGFSYLRALTKLRQMLRLFKKEYLLLDLFGEITGDVSDGIRKEVAKSVDVKSEKLVRDIRNSVHG